MAEFSVSEAQLVSLFVASIFYGIYLATFCDCLRVLVWNSGSFKATTNVKWILLVVALLMFVCETVDAIFNLQHNLDAFIFYDGPGGPAGQFKIINNWVNIGRGITFLLITLLGDGILVNTSALLSLAWDLTTSLRSIGAGQYGNVGGGL
jgi:hypothetical protein